jgi:UrcA family protein
MLMKSLLAASALGLVLAASSAQAQDYGYDNDGYANGPNESIEVIAPRIPTDHSSLAPTSATHLSVAVRYDDLDLTTGSGARELKSRVRDAARDVCETLAARFPAAAVPQQPCYRTAAEAGIARADNAISDARNYSNAGYERY